jgi:CTP synthase (UTP-ammonia lyase)
MTQLPRIAIIGDYAEHNETHRATNEELTSTSVSFEWVPTNGIDRPSCESLQRFDGLWIAPGSPYVDMDGTLAAIRYARERGVPLVGT